ncbi:hypothetical protein, variant [Capsaspora owczarzaki ATCC 30864]|uniref:Chromatin target of PRMT1 protein C-terminal domain-containing protein n=1 Tax=Capsaspora owczarzaki (strain ATCC 30864) TaxID=595528 RepID=A0A0D2UBT0_CAPO3|nr:hypothetical protein CAOG_003444 [Capsaspora owczarzaki ATCC 30864]KJE92486.1 hypothetical protein, variant [Capsaspora owczarzaki ATCC 30864]
MSNRGNRNNSNNRNARQLPTAASLPTGFMPFGATGFGQPVGNFGQPGGFGGFILANLPQSLPAQPKQQKQQQPAQRNNRNSNNSVQRQITQGRQRNARANQLDARRQAMDLSDAQPAFAQFPGMQQPVIIMAPGFGQVPQQQQQQQQQQQNRRRSGTTRRLAKTDQSVAMAVDSQSSNRRARRGRSNTGNSNTGSTTKTVAMNTGARQPNANGRAGRGTRGGRGARGGRGGRGGRSSSSSAAASEPMTSDSLDTQLTSYMMRDPSTAASMLDSQLDDYLALRSN